MSFYLDTLDAAIAPLSTAAAPRTGPELWQQDRAALDWLYRCEEVAKTSMGMDAYHDARRSTEDGKTLGGLIWLRGLSVHRQAAIREMIQRVQPMHIRINGEMIPAEFQVLRDGVWEDNSQINVLARCWPEIGRLPSATGRDREQRRWYADLVSGQMTWPPLAASRRFLGSLSAPPRRRTTRSLHLFRPGSDVGFARGAVATGSIRQARRADEQQGWRRSRFRPKEKCAPGLFVQGGCSCFVGAAVLESDPHAISVLEVVAQGSPVRRRRPRRGGP